VKWLSDTAEIEQRKGGRYKLGWNNGPTHTGTLLRYAPGKGITFAWSWDDLPTLGPTRFALSIRKRGKGTELNVEHHGIPASPKWFDLFAGAEWGWTYFAMNLKSYLETGRDLRSPIDG
jgi:uncharacterized protein YndB with AHSA1/START domain